MQREPLDRERTLATYFKQFVNQTLLKHFSTSEDAVREWNYFSSLISQDRPDYDKLKVYLEVLLSGPLQHSSNPNKPHYKPLKPPQKEEQKTNSGIYKNQQPSIEPQKLDFQLNKTVGGNTDRIKFTGGMFAAKSPNGYGYEAKDKKRFASKNSNTSMGMIIEGMECVVSMMVDNQSRLENRGEPHGGILKANSAGGGNQYYSYRVYQGE